MPGILLLSDLISKSESLVAIPGAMKIHQVVSAQQLSVQVKECCAIAAAVKRKKKNNRITNLSVAGVHPIGPRKNQIH